MPTRVWLMRHAETCRPDVFHGFESDVDLSELGYRQAAAVAPVIAAHRPDFICCSAMLRGAKPPSQSPRLAACRCKSSPIYTNARSANSSACPLNLSLASGPIP